MESLPPVPHGYPRPRRRQVQTPLLICEIAQEELEHCRPATQQRRRPPE